MNNPLDRQIDLLTNSLNTTLKELFKRIDDLSAKVDALANGPVEMVQPSVRLVNTDQQICAQLDFEKKQFLSAKEIKEYLNIKNSTLYRRIGQCRWVTPVKFGGRSSMWVAHEVRAILKAQTAGISNDDLRALVLELQERRKIK
jgi:predicted DNA-binding transcriptional regulator AlpA